MKTFARLTPALLLACTASLSQALELTPQVLHTFSGTDGRTPMMPPVLMQDGKLYGLAAGLTTRTAYQFDLSAGQFVFIAPATNANAHTNLAPASDGKLYFVSGSTATAAVRGLDASHFTDNLPPVVLTTTGTVPGTVIGASATDDENNLWVGGGSPGGTLPGLTRISIAGDTATATLFPFPGTDLNGPGGSTVLGPFGSNAFSLLYSRSDRVIYGMSPFGDVTLPPGTMSQGVVWKFDPAADGGAGAFTLLHGFAVDSTLSSEPEIVFGDGSGLIRDSGGYVSSMIEIGDWLYGTASTSSIATEIGSIWRMRKDGSQFSVVYHFSADDGGKGNYPSGALALGADGNIYGTARRSGMGTSVATEGPGVIFRVVLGELDSAADDRVELVHTFALNGVNANANPHGLARADAEGTILVGITRAGGTAATAAANAGTLYRLDIPPAVSITGFTADRTEIVDGETVTLTWTVENAVACEAGGAVDWRDAVSTTGGNTTVNPVAGSTTYTLACTGAGEDVDTAEVTVVATAPAAAQIDSFTASASSVTVGTAVTLSWSVSDATVCTASGGWNGTQNSVSGSTSVTPIEGSNTYTLSCEGAGGVDEETVTVTGTLAPAAQITAFTASASSVTVGTAVTLNWAVSNATVCTASGSWSGARNSVSGSASVTPVEGANTYTLSCEGAGGNDAETVTVTGTAAPANNSGGGGSFTPALLLMLSAGWLWRRRSAH